MPAPIIKELFDSRTLNASAKNPSVTTRYWVVNCDGTGFVDGTEQARSLIAAYTPLRYPLYPFLYRDQIRVTPLGGNTYEAESNYTRLEGVPLDGQGGPTEPHHPDPPNETDPLSTEFSFDSTGATEKKYQSYQTLSKKTLDPAGPPDFANSVNVTPEGVQGVDVVVPKDEWSFTARFEFITHAYRNRLVAMTGTANRRPFFKNDRRGCLFLGASGQWRQGDKWSVTFKFASKPTWGHDAWKAAYLDAGLAVPGAPPANAPDRLFNNALLDLLDDGAGNRLVRGWDYIWVTFQDSVSNGRKVQTPHSAYVERVYKETDFYWLGIGGAAAPPGGEAPP